MTAIYSNWIPVKVEYILRFGLKFYKDGEKWNAPASPPLSL